MAVHELDRQNLGELCGRVLGGVFGRRLDGPVKTPVDYDVAGAAAGTNDGDLQDSGKLEYQGLKGPFRHASARGALSRGGHWWPRRYPCRQVREAIESSDAAHYPVV